MNQAPTETPANGEQQLTLFPTKGIESSQYYILPGYKTIFRRNKYSLDSIALFLLRAGDIAMDLTDIKAEFIPTNQLSEYQLRGWTLIIPAAWQDSDFAKYHPETLRRVSIKAPRVTVEITTL